MSYEHKQLASGRWNEMPFISQMANIGSEVERSLNWANKKNAEYSRQAAGRALELLDLTIDDEKNASRLKEVVRLREVMADYFYFDNIYKSSELQWKKYFLNFAFAARKNY